MRIMLALAGSLLIALLSGHVQAGPSRVKVVASIKPIAFLVQEIGGEEVDLHLLVQNDVSEHDYFLRPQDIRTLNQANLIIWLSPHLEEFLVKQIDSLVKDPQKTIITAAQLEKMLLLKQRSQFPDPFQIVTKDEAYDPHLWFDLSNMQILAKEIGYQLSMLDPAHKSLFEKRVEKVSHELRQLDQKMKAIFLNEQLSSLRFIFYHDGFIYLEQSYNLRPIDILTVQDAHSHAGLLPAKISSLIGLIDSDKLDCLFLEPNTELQLLRQNKRGRKIYVADFDPSGASLPVNHDFMVKLFDQFTQEFDKCAQYKKEKEQIQLKDKLKP